MPLGAIEGKNFMLIGCGSLGTMSARILARLGVSRFHLIDPNPVTHHHLNRASFDHDHVGYNKAAALSSVLDRIHRGVRCITTSKAFSPEHLTPGKENAILVTTSNPTLPPKVIGAVSEWDPEDRPVLMVARHAGLQGGYWLADLAHDEDLGWPSDLPWLSVKDPPRPKEETRIVTTAHFAAAITVQALMDHMVDREEKTDRPRVKRQATFDLGQIVHQTR